MKIIADCHTHTIYSHGTGTIRENVEAGRKKGLKKIVISDHGPGHKLYGVSKIELFEMREEIDKLNKEYEDIEILLGLEANVMSFDGDIDVDRDILEILDVLLLGYHFGIVPKSFKDAFYLYLVNPISKVFKPLEEFMVKKSTDAIIKAIDRYPIKLITHPGSKARLDIYRLSRECSKRDIYLEISGKHSQLSVESLREAMKTDVKFLANSDGHSPDKVGDIDRALERIEKVNLDISRIDNLQKTQK